MEEQNSLTRGSLFDGSGGFPLGGLISGIAPLWASEIEPFPIRVTTKRLPQVKHYGDISKMNGAEIPPVDIITFGSPCQDMSIAGKRDGLGGSRSSLFYEAVRIIKEMRCKTDGRKPRFIVWENVPGAFSSNKGEDFRAVLEEVCKIKDESVSVPKPNKWNRAGKIMGDNYSVAWRQFDAQFWGVPQRRKRIYLVADFADWCAGKILFESEGLSGYSKESIQSWQGSASAFREGTPATSIVLNDQGGNRMDVTDDVTCTLRAEGHHPPCVMESAGFCTEHSANARGIGYEVEKSPTLRAGVVPATVYENHGQDSRYTGPLEVAQTVLSTYGTGGNNQPFIVEDRKCYDVRLTSEGSRNARHNVYETDTSRTIDTGGNSPDSNQGGVAVVAYGICSKDSNSMKSDNPNSGFYEADTSRTLDGNGGNPSCNQGGIAVIEGNGSGVAHPVFSSSKSSLFTTAKEELANTLVATDYKDPPIVNDEMEEDYIVRRLTPTECAKLQGFPDWWCDDLGTEEPTNEEIAYWKDVFKTHAEALGKNVKPKTDSQIKKWLKNPHSDSAEYKMWGNGVALPNVVFVLSGIVYYSQFSAE